MSPKGTCQAPCPSLGSLARGLLAGRGWGSCSPGAAEVPAGGTQQWGGRRCPCSTPRCWGSQWDTRLGCPSPSPPPQTKCWVRGRLSPSTPLHPTSPAGRGATGLGGPSTGCLVMTPWGAVWCGGCAIPTPMPPPTARAGSPGDRHPPGAPRSEPPHQPGPGEPPSARPPRGGAGGAGEGARR